MNDQKNIKRIVLAAPFERQSLQHLLPEHRCADLPEGYPGAPYLVSLVENYLKRGIEMVCITTSLCIDGNFAPQTFKHGKFTLVVVPARKRPFSFNGNRPGKIVDLFYHERKAIKKCILAAKPDIVHAFWTYEFSWAALNTGLPCLVTAEDNAYQILKHMRSLYRFLRLIMAEVVLSKTQHVTTLSPYMVPFISKRCKNVKVIPNPTKFLFSPMQVDDLIGNRVANFANPKIVMINNGWDQRKNVSKAIDAFVLFQQDYPLAELYLYGNGYGKNGPAQHYAKQTGANRIHFMGKVSQAEVLSSLDDAHIFLHSSLEESQGVVLLEAMSRGVPCIGGDKSGAVPWVINNQDLLTDVSSARAMSDKMKGLLNEGGYRAASLKGFNWGKRTFDADHIAGQFFDCYQDII